MAAVDYISVHYGDPNCVAEIVEHLRISEDI